MRNKLCELQEDIMNKKDSSVFFLTISYTKKMRHCFDYTKLNWKLNAFSASNDTPSSNARNPLYLTLH